MPDTRVRNDSQTGSVTMPQMARIEHIFAVASRVLPVVGGVAVAVLATQHGMHGVAFASSGSSRTSPINIAPVSVSSHITGLLTWLFGIGSAVLGIYAAIHFFLHSFRLMGGAHNPQKRQSAIEGLGWTAFAAIIGFGITAVLGILDGVAKHHL